MNDGPEGLLVGTEWRRGWERSNGHAGKRWVCVCVCVSGAKYDGAQIWQVKRLARTWVLVFETCAGGF